MLPPVVTPLPPPASSPPLPPVVEAASLLPLSLPQAMATRPPTIARASA
jgi:hypothetical protein